MKKIAVERQDNLVIMVVSLNRGTGLNSDIEISRRAYGRQATTRRSEE
jgi:hypothetical protein